MTRASSRAGLAAPVISGRQRSRRRASRSPAWPSGASTSASTPTRASNTNRGATSAPRPARAMNPSGEAAARPPRASTISPSRPPRVTATTWAPASRQPLVMSSVSSVPPEYDNAKTRVRGPTNAGGRIRLSTVTGTGSSPLVTEASTSPAIPEPPRPTTTMLSMSPACATPSNGTARAASLAAASCSGRRPTCSRKSSESVGIGKDDLGLERRLDTVGFGFGQEPLVLGVAHGLRLVDEHDRDVVPHRVTAMQPRVVQRVLVGEVEQRALVLGAGEDLEQLGVECHVGSAPGRVSATHEREHLSGARLACGTIGGFEVEP